MDHERDGGRHGDVDMDDLRLRRLGAPKMIDLLAAVLRMMKRKKVWPTKSESHPSLHLAPLYVRKASSRCALAILIVRLAFAVVDRRWTLWR